MTYSDWLPDDVIDAALARRGIDPADPESHALVSGLALATCAYPPCAREFEPAYPSQRYCSQLCGRRSNVGGSRRPVALRPCQECGEVIPREDYHTPRKYSLIKFCPACRATGYSLPARSHPVKGISRRTVMVRRDGVRL